MTAKLQTGMTVRGFEQDSKEPIVGQVTRVSALTAIIVAAGGEKRVIKLEGVEILNNGKNEKKETLGDRLKRFRADKGLTQQQVADELGIEQTYISQFERDKKQPEPEHLTILSELYGVPLHEIRGYQKGDVIVSHDPSVIKSSNKEKLKIEKDGNVKLVSNQPEPLAIQTEEKQEVVDKQEPTVEPEPDIVTETPIILPKQTSKTTAALAVISDMVHSPKHYVGLEGTEVRTIQKEFVPKYAKYGVMVAADIKDVIKYVLRAPDKNGIEDLKKAQKILSWVIKDIEEEKHANVEQG